MHKKDIVEWVEQHTTKKVMWYRRLKRETKCTNGYVLVRVEGAIISIVEWGKSIKMVEAKPVPNRGSCGIFWDDFKNRWVVFGMINGYKSFDDAMREAEKDNILITKREVSPSGWHMLGEPIL